MFSFSKILAAATLTVLGVSAQVQGPFALYVTSTNPTWNGRIVNTGARSGFYSVLPDVFGTGPSNIPVAQKNFYINATNVLSPVAGEGELIWGPLPPFGEVVATIGTLDPTSNTQPLTAGNRALSGVSTRFGILPDGRLHLAGATSFYAALLTAPRFNSDALWWKFGSGASSDPNAVAVEVHTVF